MCKTDYESVSFEMGVSSLCRRTSVIRGCQCRITWRTFDSAVNLCLFGFEMILKLKLHTFSFQNNTRYPTVEASWKWYKWFAAEWGDTIDP